MTQTAAVSSSPALDKAGFAIIAAMPIAALGNIFTLFHVGGLSFHATDLLFCVGLLLAALTLLLVHGARISPRWYLIAILMMFETSVSGIALLGNVVDWAKYFRFLETLMWGILALIFVRDERQCQKFLNSVIVAATVLGGSSVYLFITNPALQRIAGYFSYAGAEGLDVQASYNELGAFYSVALAVMMWRIFTNGWSLLRVILLVIIGSGLLLTQSRSSFLATAAVIVIFALFWIRKVSREGFDSRNLGAAFSVVILLICAFFASSMLSINRISESFVSGSNAESSVSVRYDLWHKALDLWTTGPGRFLLGYGSAKFDTLLQSSTADCFYLDHGLSQGLVGLLLILSILVAPSFKLWRDSSEKQAALLAIAVLAVALIVSITGNVLVDPMFGGVTFALSYGTLAAYRRTTAAYF